MAITYVGKGTLTSSTNDPTDPAWPTHQAGDLGIVLVETANQPISTPSGWTQIGSTQAMGTAGSANAVSIQVFYKFAAGSSETAPAIPDSGNHTVCQTHVWRGVDPTTPLDGTPTGGTGTGTSLSLTGLTTTKLLSHLVAVVATDRDAASTTNFSSWANASLESITEQHDQSVTAGQGGGFALASGDKAAAGAVDATTVTGPNEEYAWLVFALRAIHLELSDTADLAAATTSTATVTVVSPPVILGGTVWDDGETVWDSGTTTWDGPGLSATIAAASTATATVVCGTSVYTYSGTGALAANLVSAGAVSYLLPISLGGSAALTAAISVDGDLPLTWAASGSATLAAATTAAGTLAALTETVWDSGTTVWDGGLTIWDSPHWQLSGTAGVAVAVSAQSGIALGIGLSGTATIAGAVSAIGSIPLALPISLEGTASLAAGTTVTGAVDAATYTIWDSGATVWDSGTTTWDSPWWVLAGADARISGALTAAAELALISPPVGIEASASIAAAISASAGIQSTTPDLPVWYEDIRAHSLWVGAHPAEALYRGSVLLWEAQSLRMSGTADLAADTTAGGSFDLGLELTALAAVTVAAETTGTAAVSYGLAVSGSAAAAISAETDGTAELAIVLPISVAATATASIAAAASASAAIDLRIDVTATSSATIAAALTVAGDSQIGVPPIFEVAGTAQTAAVVSASGAVGFALLLEGTSPITVPAGLVAAGGLFLGQPLAGTATVAAATQASGAFAHVLEVAIAADGPALIDAATDSTATINTGSGLAGIAQIPAQTSATATIRRGVGLSGLAQTAAQTSASGAFSLTIPWPLQAAAAAQIAAQTSANGDVIPGALYATTPADRTFSVQAEARVFDVQQDDREFYVRGPTR